VTEYADDAQATEYAEDEQVTEDDQDAKDKRRPPVRN
jgi:hypothetical protein